MPSSRTRKPRKPRKQREGCFLLIADTHDPALARVASEVLHLLGLAPRTREVEVVYGQVPSRPGEIAILTRSMLSVLNQIGSQVDVPPEDVARNLTMPTIANVGIEHRPVVIGALRSVPTGRCLYVDQVSPDMVLDCRG